MARSVPRRWMLFVDGENLTIRAQALLKERAIEFPAESDYYRRDCFVWPWGKASKLPSISPFNEPLPARSFYYTSLFGDDKLIRLVKEQLWALEFEPHVFKKVSREEKAKGVDIALTKDMLSHAFRGNYEMAQLFAGDGDYVLLIEEVKRLGKSVSVCFMKEYTNPELRLAADRFMDITEWIVRLSREQARASES